MVELGLVLKRTSRAPRLDRCALIVTWLLFAWFVGSLEMASRRKETRYEVHEAAVLTVGRGPSATVFAVTVLDISRSGMRVSLPANLEVDSIVSVRRSSGTICGTIRYSRNAGQGEYHAGIQVTDVPTERRREPRYAVHDEGTVRVLAGGFSQTHAALVTDVSRSGFCVELNRPVVVGAEIQLTLKSTVLFGKVRHCRAAGNIFRDLARSSWTWS